LTQPTKKFELWARMYTRFLLEPLAAHLSQSPAVSTVIQPITDADVLLQRPGSDLAAGVSVGAGVSANNIAFTVPDKERWTVLAFDITRATGDNLIDAFSVGDVSAGDIQVFDTQSGGSEFVSMLRQGVTLEEGDTVRFRTDGTGVSTSTFNMRVWRVVEDLF